jgi:activating signal cointegrator 1
VKAITLWEPWASLMACGAKSIETRSWGANYRGPLLVHASKKSGEDIVAYAHWARETVKEHRFRPSPGSLEDKAALRLYRDTLGCVLAVVDLVEIRWTGATGGIHPDWLDRLLPLEREFGDYSPNRFGWVTTNLRPLATPIPWKGSQGLWDAPEKLVRLVEEQLPGLASSALASPAEARPR